METSTQLVKVDYKEFGIEESKANLILERFEPLQVKMQELEDEYQKVLALDIEDPMTELAAKELGKKYMKIRTGRGDIHKQEKAFFLNAGRFVDRIKNDADKSTIEHEDALEKIAKHYANLQAEKIKELANSRIEKLKEFDFDGSSLNLGTMDNNVWISFLSGTEMAFKAKKEEEKKAELAKIEAENNAIRERARIEEENKALKLAAEAKEKELEAERLIAKQKEIEAENLRLLEKAKSDKILQLQKEQADKELEVERKAAEAKAKEIEALRINEQKKADELLEAQRKEAAKQKEVADAKLKKEHEANEKLKAELKSKKDAEDKAEAIKQAEIKAKALADKKAAAAPDKEKMLKAVNDLTLELYSIDFSNQNIAISINAKFDGFKKWAIDQINTL